ncbi:hypothetical protein [Streptomyces sp. NPDC050738]|uniref:hypothetical protein n=1 Tax=Streptomyces sp. NPDC050738 TaxID=3154744 RepID=UPI00341364B8
MSEGPGSPERFDDSELLEMTRQDPAQARLLRKSLEELSSGRGGDALKEMAQDVLAGRSSLRDAARVSAYSEEILTQAAPMTARWAALSEAERAELAAEGERQIAAAQAEIDEERRTALRDGGTKSRHDGRGWSAY